MEHNRPQRDDEGRDEQERIEKIEFVVDELAYFVTQGIVTEDNPSPSNHLTSLDQIIQFELDEYLDDKFNVGYIKACVTKEIAETKYYEYTAEIDDEDWWDEDDPYLDVTEFINQPDVKDDIERIAIYIFLNVLTEDNRSPSNDCNTVEQLIPFHFSQYFGYTWDYDEDIWKAIHEHLILISGGTDLSYLYKNKNFMDDYFVDYDA